LLILNSNSLIIKLSLFVFIQKVRIGTLVVPANIFSSLLNIELIKLLEIVTSQEMFTSQEIFASQEVIL